MSENQSFKTESGKLIPTIALKNFEQLIQTLNANDGISLTQITEAAGYSLAMVLRVALGFGADNARLLVLAQDNLPGWIALSASRQLSNAGSYLDVYATETDGSSELFNQLVKSVKSTSENVSFFSETLISDITKDQLQSYHLVLSGLGNSSTSSSTEKIDKFIELLNDNQVPVHSIFSPYNINGDTGEKINVPIISSSTLSLGIPLAGLNSALDYIGRHYLCDISIPLSFYKSAGMVEGPIFSEQPVIQIFPIVTASVEDEVETPQS